MSYYTSQLNMLYTVAFRINQAPYTTGVLYTFLHEDVWFLFFDFLAPSNQQRVQEVDK